MIHICICDDSPSDISHCTNLILSITNKVEISTYTSGKSLLFNCDKGNVNQFDIIFMDIEMEGMNGIETMKSMRNLGYSGKLIYLTMVRDYVFDSFDTNPLNYLLKFEDFAKFKSVFEKVLEDLHKTDCSTFIFSSKNNQYKLKVNDIMYLESRARKLIIHLKNGDTYSCYMKLSTALDQLQKLDFIRIQKSFAINCNFVIGLKSNMVYLQKNIEIPIGRTYISEAKQTISKFLSLD